MPNMWKLAGLMLLAGIALEGCGAGRSARKVDRPTSKFALSFGVERIKDPATQAAAQAASPDIEEALLDLCNGLVSGPDTFRRLRMNGHAPTLLPPNTPRDARFPSHPLMRREPFIFRGASEWALGKDGRVSFIATFADVRGTEILYRERQTYERRDTHWVLVDQEAL